MGDCGIIQSAVVPSTSRAAGEEMSEKDDLQDRVEKFRAMELPGQPMGMHMGTANLVSDLWREVRHLRDLVKAYKEMVK